MDKRNLEENSNKVNIMQRIHENKSGEVLITTSIAFITFVILTVLFFVVYFQKSNTSSITYNEKSNVNYSVCLKNNNYFDNNCLKEGKTYVADLMDHINIDFSYKINSSVALEQNYSYNITSRIIATSKEDNSKVIYDKTAILENNKKFTNKNKNIADINKSIVINYDDYSKIITNFKKDYILALNAKLLITMNVKYEGKYSPNFDNINNTKALTIEIPLSEQTVSIAKSNNVNINNTLYKNISNSKIVNYVLYFLIIVDLILLIIVMYAVVKLIPNKKEYLKKLDKILKEYDRAIVTVKKAPDISGYKVIEVESFDEMLDARDNLERPILLYKSKRTDKSVFTIINDNEAYVYVLKVKYGG